MPRKPAMLLSLLNLVLRPIAGQMTTQPNQLVVPPLQPPAHDRDAWHACWNAQDQPWRTEPEISAKRQEYLAKRRTISPDIKQGIYPFKDIKLSRADVEWLLATLDKQGPVDWSDENQRKRKGLDLRGADLREHEGHPIDLSNLPLSCLHAGLSFGEWNDKTGVNRTILSATLKGVIQLSNAELKAAHLSEVHLQGANLSGAHLEGAHLAGAHLEGAILSQAYLEGANLSGAHLEKAELVLAHLERTHFFWAQLQGALFAGAFLNTANLWCAHAEEAIFNDAQLQGVNLADSHLKGAIFSQAWLKDASLRMAHLENANFVIAYLQGANLSQAHLENAYFGGAQLQGANLSQAHLEGAILSDANLQDADLSRAYLEGAELDNIILANNKYIGPQVVDLRWGNTNLSVVKWPQIKMTGEEHKARQKKEGGKKKDRLQRWEEYQQALRATHQLTTVLQDQGLTTDATRFAYRTKCLERNTLWHQLLLTKTVGGRIQVLGAWLFSWFLFLMAGYGYKLWHSFVTYLFIIGIFLSFYLLVSYFFTPHLTWDEALVLSMSSFHGRGFFPSDISLGDPYARISVVEGFVGLFVEVILIATLTQRFFGK